VEVPVKIRDVSRPGASLSVHELSLDAPVRDIPDDRWIAPSPEPVTRFEVAAVAFFVSVLVNLLVGLVALVAMAALAWSLP
jgi:hypothetical protein